MSKSQPQWVLDYLRRQEAINNFARKCFQPRLRRVDKILIYHPDEYRRYLKRHPCVECKARPCCRQPCEVFTQWEKAKRRGAPAGNYATNMSGIPG